MTESQTHNPAPKVALIGFGEAGYSFAVNAGWSGNATAWDLLEARRAMVARCGVEASANAAGALKDADIVLSLVTADAALPATRDYAPLLKPGAMWCDMNSIAPATKQEAAKLIEAAGARYTDVAVMAPVNQTLEVPLLIAGPHAAETQTVLSALGFQDIKIAGTDVGRASSIKMIRSIMVKGLEALTYECGAAADAAGVFDEVMASLDASEKDWDWATKLAYNRERMETHGLRRAAEVEEVCQTLLDLGIEPVMSQGTVKRQRAAAQTHKAHKE